MRACNYGYVTLLSTVDYLPAVLVLAESLKKVNSYYPLVVGIPKDIFDQVKEPLMQAGCFLEQIERLSYSQKVIDKFKNSEIESVLNTASKISLFNLSWDKLVYIDADTIVLQNIDDLFNWPDGSMVKYSGEHGGFTGLMVFQPLQHDADFYKILLKNTQCADGDLLGKLWYPCKTNPAYQIPSNYMRNYNPVLETEFLEPSQWSDIKIIHFCNNPKPWIKRPEEHEHQWYIHYYLTMLDQVITKYHLK